MKTLDSDSPADFGFLAICTTLLAILVYGACALVKDFFTGDDS